VASALQGPAQTPSAQVRLAEPKAVKAGELGVPLELEASTEGA
jgi:hypothetical protein